MLKLKNRSKLQGGLTLFCKAVNSVLMRTVCRFCQVHNYFGIILF